MHEIGHIEIKAYKINHLLLLFITYAIPQQYWRRPDGSAATREHLMMALADLKYVMVKATYTGDTAEVGLRDTSLDIAEPRRTGQDKAYAVEQCNCPRGYIGTSCEVSDR